MHVHILGICGTFMGGIALLARAAGHRVTGSDAHVYPPMSTQLEASGISLMEGYDSAHLDPAPDRVVVGNVMTRGNPAVEYMLDQGLPYVSGPQWLAEHVLAGQHVLAVAGTHGKTSTASMLAWILEDAGLEPGFLIGGVPANFGVSARAGAGRYFVVEADEYDTAFFDKRSKFVHYRPRTLIMNNLEFDHADIFPDLDAIRRQFHHLVRTVPGSGRILVNAGDSELASVLAMGCWTPVEWFGEDASADWSADEVSDDASSFRVNRSGRPVGRVHWSLIGRHNLHNGLAAAGAAAAAGVAPDRAADALGRFQNVRRRLERYATVDGVNLYDDFAHHPTEIAATLAALRARVGNARIIAVLEPRSNTMRMGVHRDRLGPSLEKADRAFVFRPDGLDWDPAPAVAALGGKARICDSTATIADEVAALAQPGDHVLVMSNGSFEGLHQRLRTSLEARAVRSPATGAVDS